MLVTIYNIIILVGLALIALSIIALPVMLFKQDRDARKNIKDDEYKQLELF